MTTDEIPNGATEAFVALALLEHPMQVWRAGTIATRLRIGSGNIRKALNKFAEAGALERNPAQPGGANHYRVTTDGTKVLRQLACDNLTSGCGLTVASYVGFDVHALLGQIEAAPPELRPEYWHPNAVTILSAFVERPENWATNRYMAALANISVGAATRHVRKLTAHGLVEKRCPPRNSIGRGQIPAQFRLANEAVRSANAIIREAARHEQEQAQ